jgi:Protein of unknown function (DUF2845)
MATAGRPSYSRQVNRAPPAAVLLLLASAFLPNPAIADDTMRCGTRIVSVGDGKDRVRSLCGEPTSVAFVGTIGRRSYPDYDPYDYSYVGPAWVELPVELWTYNFGSTKLLRKLRFVGDELVEIRTDGHGY